MPNVPYQPKVSIGARSSPEEVSLRDSGWRPYVPVPVELPTWVPVLPRRVDATDTAQRRRRTLCRGHRLFKDGWEI